MSDMNYDVIVQQAATQVKINELAVKQDKKTLKELKLKCREDKAKSREELKLQKKQDLLKKFEQKLNEKELEKDLEEQEYEKTKVEFEKKHFKVMNPLLFVTLMDDGEMIFKQKSPMKDTYENFYYADEKCFIDKWFKDPKMRSYNKIDFLPNACPDNVYNLYTGLKVDNLKITENPQISLIKKHIEEVLCDSDEASYNFFYKWLAQIVQQPGKLSRIAIVFISNQGAGKNTFTDWFGNEILGSKYYTTTSNIDHICGDFAQGLKSKFFVNLDETNGKETFANSNRLKNLITQEIIQYVSKGKDAINISNFARFIFTTNNNTPIKVDPDDRRFVVFSCSNKFNNNDEYFKKLRSEMYNESNTKAFYDYLMSIDISNVDWVNDRPKTAAYEDLRSVNIPVVARFLSDLYDSRSSDTMSYLASELFNKFNNFLNNNKYSIEYNSTSFGRELKKYDGVEKGHSNKGSKYLIDYTKILSYLTKMNYYEVLPEVDDTDDEDD